MMYFSPDVVKKIANRLHESLLDDRWLVVGSSETSQFYFPQYITVNFPGAILYKRTNGEAKKRQRVENYIPNAVSGDEKVPIGFPESNDHFIPNLDLKPFKEEKEEVAQKWESVEESEQTVSSMEEVKNRYQAGDYKGTIRQILERVDNYQDNPQAMKYLAKAFANQGKLNEAMNWCEKAIVLDKLNPQFYHLRAAILEEQGHIDKALGELKRALYLDPNFVLAHFMLGNLTRKQGNIPESKKYFQNALSILRNHDREEILPESEGMNAGRLTELIQLSMNGELNA
jgi:chemotaxis protein methyltransferase CheR